jgi:hypothetical protein
VRRSAGPKEPDAVFIEDTPTTGRRRRARATPGTHGHEVRQVTVAGCLHLKTAVTRVGDDLLLLN